MSKLKVAAVFEIPTPYRQPVLERIATQEGVTTDFFFLNRTQADRHWTIPEATHFTPRYLPGTQVCIRGHHTFHLNWNILKALEEKPYDVYVIGGYAQWGLSTLLRSSWKKKLPYVMVTESHLAKRRAGWLQAIKRKYVSKVYTNAGANLVTGSAAHDYVLSYGAVDRNIFLFPNTIDGPDFARRAGQARSRKVELRRSLGYSEKDIVVLYVGTLNRRKGVDLLLAAFQRLAQRNPGLKLLIAGTGPLDPSIRSLARGGFQDRIVCSGFVEGDELIEHYAIADLFVLPSRDEPFGAVVCEAAAAGLPVIVSDAVGAGRDFVLHDKSGLIFPSGDITALAEDLQSMLEKPDFRTEAGKAGQELMVQWSHDRLARNFVSAAEAAVRETR